MYFERGGGFGGGAGRRRLALPAPTIGASETDAKGVADEASTSRAAEREPGDKADKNRRHGGDGGQPPGPDLSKVSARKNLNETAFFFPHLIAGHGRHGAHGIHHARGADEVEVHGLRPRQGTASGFLQDEVVTAKDLMVQPNPPRFLREGDMLEFTVKVTNQSPTQADRARCASTLADARTGQAGRRRCSAITQHAIRRSTLPPGESRRFFVDAERCPTATGPLTYKAVGSTDKLSDGEEGMLPVLSRRILVTESLPLPIRGPQTKTFDFTKLRESGKSDTLQAPER